MTNPQTPRPEMIEALIASGLIADDDRAAFEPLTGGVSSDIWKVTAEGKTFCVKQALAKLKVAADWFAPVERSDFEVLWYRIAADLVPGCTPEILIYDEQAKLFAMTYLDPGDFKLWKSELRDGNADVATAAEVGKILGKIHAGTAGVETIRARFPRPEIFHAIRLEPYLEATAAKHPELADRLMELSKRTASCRAAMVHGDVSPKNILIGPDGPVFLDAECATYGDPAFDLAFCINHFLLKCLWVPTIAADYMMCFDKMCSAYLAEVNWEPAGNLEARAAELLPGLTLARVDGKSPVEYVTDEQDKKRVRQFAKPLILNSSSKLSDIANRWKRTIDL